MRDWADYTTQDGRLLRLGRLLGKGGEGEIYDLADDPSLAVKLYTDGREDERLPKLRAMVADKLVEQAPFVAFPQDLVLADGRFAGFLMRRVAGSRPLFKLCLTADRKAEFPAATYRFLVRVALNYARAIASLHALGAVVGDINESGALVSRQGLVTVIDSDSFQYSSGGITHRCPVGKPDFTPPELQGRSLRDMDRTPDHDAFGLAVILFELLFLGRHPFQGVPRGTEVPTIAEAIVAHRFAYSPHRALTAMDPPKHMPVLTDLPDAVAAAFQRAFGPYPGEKPLNRPTAKEWVSLLEDMEKTLIGCKNNLAHAYSRSAGSCPWCRFEAGYSLILFVYHPPLSIDIEQLVARINAIPHPGEPPDLLPQFAILPKPDPTQEAKDLKARRQMRRMIAEALAGLAVLLVCLNVFWGVLFFIPAALIFFMTEAEVESFARRYLAAERRWRKEYEAWCHMAGPERFDTKRADLDRLVSAHRAFPDLEYDLLADAQLKAYLRSHTLNEAYISGVGIVSKDLLRTAGINTALDITRPALRVIPGMGRMLTDSLLRWRYEVEQSFKFDPSRPPDDDELAQPRKELDQHRSSVVAGLLKGVSELEGIHRDILAHRHDIQACQSTYLALQQADVDRRLFI